MPRPRNWQRAKGALDEVAAEVLRRYIAHEKLEELVRFGQQRAREMGLDKLPEDEREEFIPRFIRQARQERSRE